MIDAVGERSLSDLLEERATDAPDQEALVVEAAGGCTRLTFAALEEASRRTAAGFAALGVATGDRVLVQLPNSVEAVLAWLGLARLGAVFVPSNTANTAREVRHIIDLAGIRLVVGTPATLEVVVAADRDVRLVDPAEIDGPPRPPLPRPTGDTLVELAFTSGSTAAPKAAMITQANCLFSGLQKSAAMGLTDEDVVLSALPFFHVNAQSALLAAWSVGATMVLLESYSASSYWEQLARHDATVTSFVSTQVRTLLRQPASDADRVHRVRRAWFALDLSVDERDAFQERFGVRLLNGYGLTEAFTSVCQSPLHGDDRWPAVGLPLLGREVRTVDAEGFDVAPGEVGEIVVKGTPGRTVMAGYWADPAATAGALRGGWLHTGDRGRLDERGYLHFVGRKTDMIKRAGENIAAAEVEAVLLSHPGVLEAAVIGIPDDVRDEAVKAVLVLAEGTDVAAVDAHARERLASFKVPTVWEQRDALPKTSIGKIRKSVLRPTSSPLSEVES